MTARPNVPGPMPYMADGGNWEGGCTDTTGQRWLHRPNVGWERRSSRHPFLGPPQPRRWWQRLWRWR